MKVTSAQFDRNPITSHKQVVGSNEAKFHARGTLDFGQNKIFDVLHDSSRKSREVHSYE